MHADPLDTNAMKHLRQNFASASDLKVTRRPLHPRNDHRSNRLVRPDTFAKILFPRTLRGVTRFVWRKVSGSRASLPCRMRPTAAGS